MNIDTLWKVIVELGIATEQELDLVTCLNGYTEEILNDVIYIRTGYHDLQQYEEAVELQEPDDCDNDLGYDPFMGSYTYDC